jgi:hypothetical protein
VGSAHGETGVIGHVYPVGIDGLIVAASMVLLDSARHKERAPQLAYWLLGSGIGGTVVANVLAGVSYGWLGSVIAAWPAYAFVGSYELLMMLVRASARRAKKTHESGLTDFPGSDSQTHLAEKSPDSQADESLASGLTAGESANQGARGHAGESDSKGKLQVKTSVKSRARIPADSGADSRSDKIRLAVTEIAQARGLTDSEVTNADVVSHLLEKGTRVRASNVADVRRRDSATQGLSDSGTHEPGKSPDSDSRTHGLTDPEPAGLRVIK